MTGKTMNERNSLYYPGTQKITLCKIITKIRTLNECNCIFSFFFSFSCLVNCSKGPAASFCQHYFSFLHLQVYTKELFSSQDFPRNRSFEKNPNKIAKRNIQDIEKCLANCRLTPSLDKLSSSSLESPQKLMQTTKKALNEDFF